MTEDVIIERLDTLIVNNKEEHKKIVEQTTKTNGRLRLIEKIIWSMSGAIIILGIISSGFIFPALIKVLFK